MKKLLISALAFSAGVGVGIYGTWCYMDHQWRSNPYRFKVIVEHVIARREAQRKNK